MQKNNYFTQVVYRKNVIKEAIFDITLKLCNYFRLVQEVFIRKNFGQRYFNFSIALMVGIILFFLPLVSDIFSSMLTSRYYYDGGGLHRSNSTFWQHYATWYIYWGAYMWFSFLRWQEVRAQRDFSRYSLSEGDILPFFFTLKVFGKELNLRQIVIYAEPGLFLVAGILLHLFHQKVGILLEVCSIVSGLSYAGAYSKGDDYVLNIVDQMHMSNALSDAFMNDNPNNKAGVRFYADKPNNEDLRQKVADTMVENEPVAYAV